MRGRRSNAEAQSPTSETEPEDKSADEAETSDQTDSVSEEKLIETSPIVEKVVEKVKQVKEKVETKVKAIKAETPTRVSECSTLSTCNERGREATERFSKITGI